MRIVFWFNSQKHVFNAEFNQLHTMRKCAFCAQCVFILSLSWMLVFGQDAAEHVQNVASGASENISSDSELKEETKSDITQLEPSAESVEDNNFKQLFVEASSQNAGVANELSTGGGQPVVLTLSDVATAELQQRAVLSSHEEKPNLTQANTTQSINQSTSRSEPQQQTENLEILNIKDNLTEEEIPSFSEWAQKQLEEEKNKEPSNTSTHQQHSNGKQTTGAKHIWKNYASVDCGAKVVAANPEVISPSAILSPSRDEYKLNLCTSKIWFVVELCEAIQAKKIDLANFELFSSSPKDFVVSVSDRFPSKEWVNVGHFTAKDERTVQSFDLNPHLFGKFIKVEVKSHYGSEHYCPISLFRVYGTSEFEVLQKEDVNVEDEDDDTDENLVTGDASKDLFSSATDAVISMVKKAAQVLGNKGNHSNQTEPTNQTKAVPLVRVCTSPSHIVVCDNCTDDVFGQVYGLLSCHDANIRALIAARLIYDTVMSTNICQSFGFDFSKTAPLMVHKYVEAMLPHHYVGALCNYAAILQNKVVLNVSNHYINVTKPDENIVNIETSEPHVIPNSSDKVTTTLNLNESVKSTCSTDVTLAAQIKPTKTQTIEISDSQEDGLQVEVTVTEAANVTEAGSGDNAEEKLDGVIGDSTEGIEDPLETLMEENGAPTTATPQGQKESVFLRLSNRIKALERNMSLSGQYLEELSKRYKKQVEEIQKLLDKTIVSINEESKKKDERNKELEDRLLALTASVESLLAERNSWSSTIYCVLVSCLVTLFVFTFCCKIPDPVSTRRPELKRRRSIDVVRVQPQQKKKRRPSDQALKIVRSMEVNENQRRKKKKKPTLKRSNSIGTLTEGKIDVWTRQDSEDWVEKRIEDVPFVLEESEHSTLEPVVLTSEQRFVKTALSSRAVRTNGEVKTQKSVSLDESSRLNGGLVESTPKDKRRGLKKFLKKVF